MSAAPHEETLLTALSRGGYVLYFRHAATDWSQSDRTGPREEDIRSCDPERMRQLSEEGRRVARRVGAAVRALGIPVGLVLSSEYCRCVETAELLALGPVETTRDVVNALAAELVGGRDALRRRVQRRLSTKPPTGTNTVIVAHGNVFRLVADRRPAEAGTVVVRPGGGQGTFKVMARLAPADWLRMAERERGWMPGSTVMEGR